MTAQPDAAPPVVLHPVVLFDGVCHLCQWSVRFIVARDPRGRFRFAALQSAAARRLLGTSEASGIGDSIVLCEDGRVHRESSAVLRIARRLRFPYPLFWLCLAVPRPLRDAVYRFIARRRYRWFGRDDQCFVPSPELARRFLDSPPTDR